MGGTFGCLFNSKDSVPISVLTSLSSVFYSLKIIRVRFQVFSGLSWHGYRNTRLEKGPALGYTVRRCEGNPCHVKSDVFLPDDLNLRLNFRKVFTQVDKGNKWFISQQFN